MVSVSKSDRSARTCRSRALAHVPFDFVVGDRVLEAGAYSIEPSDMLGMLAVRRAGSESQPVLVQAVRGGPGRAVHKLLFYFQQDLYFLAQVVVGLN
jgi:hypothetical protein